MAFVGALERKPESHAGLTEHAEPRRTAADDVAPFLLTENEVFVDARAEHDGPPADVEGPLEKPVAEHGTRLPGVNRGKGRRARIGDELRVDAAKALAVTGRGRHAAS